MPLLSHALTFSNRNKKIIMYIDRNEVFGIKKSEACIGWRRLKHIICINNYSISFLQQAQVRRWVVCRGGRRGTGAWSRV